MSRTITVEGDVNTVDVRTVLTTQGSITAPSLVVPAGMTRITKVIATGAADNLADDGSVAFFVRLGGSAVLGGEQVIVFGGLGGQLPQTGSDVAPSVGLVFVHDDADIAVQASDTVSISVEAAGVDPGDTTVAVTLVYAP